LSLSTVRLLARGGYDAIVVTPDPRSLAAVSRWCSGVVRLPDPAPESVADVAEALLGDSGYLTALPASDGIAIALDPTKATWLDKRHLERRVTEAGLSVPPTQVFDGGHPLVHAAGSLTLPIFVKPAMGTVGTVCWNISDLQKVGRSRTGPLLVQPYLREVLRSVGGVMWDGHLVAAVHQRTRRTYPPAGGVATSSITTEPDLALEERIQSLVGEASGIFQVQLLGRYVIDVNLRPFGSMELAARAGVNLPAWQCALVDGRRPPDKTRRARPNVRYRWFEGELRHLAALQREGNLPLSVAIDVVRPRLGVAAGGVGRLNDPAPAVLRARRAATRLEPSGRTSDPKIIDGLVPVEPRSNRTSHTANIGDAPVADARRTTRTGDRVIVVGAIGARLSVAMLRALDHGGYETTFVTAAPRSVATASRSCHHVVRASDPAPASVAAKAKELLNTGAFIAALAGNDRVAIELDPWKRPWTDKTTLRQLAVEAGINMPEEAVYPSLEELIDAALEYPCFVKPAFGRAGIRCIAPRDLIRLEGRSGPFVVQPVLLPPLEAFSGVLWKGDLLAAVHHRTIRTLPPEGGVATAARTVHANEDREQSVHRLLQGVDGIFQVQYLGGKLIDVNLRCYGSLSLSVRAGANLPAIYCDAAQGRLPREIVRARPGVRYRWGEGEIRHLRRRISEGTVDLAAFDALVPRPVGASGGVASLDDLGPAAFRLSAAVRKLGRRLEA